MVSQDKSGTLGERSAYAGLKLLRDVVVGGGIGLAAEYAISEAGADTPVALWIFAGLAAWRVLRQPFERLLGRLIDRA